LASGYAASSAPDKYRFAGWHFSSALAGASKQSPTAQRR
jgi:hypothetical protein